MIVAAVIFAIVTAVEEGLIVFTQFDTADQLAANIANSYTATIDLPSKLTDSNFMQGLYSLFVGATQPAPTFTDCDNSGSGSGLIIVGGSNPSAEAPCLNATSIPAQASYDPQWVVTPQGSTTSTTQSTLNWADAVSGLDMSTYLNGNWFVNTTTVANTSATVQSLRMQYTDWNGNENTAWLFSSADPPQFLTVSDSALGSGFDPSTCQSAGTCSVTPTLDVVGSDGKNYTVGVTGGGVEPPPLPVLPPACRPRPRSASTRPRCRPPQA